MVRPVQRREQTRPMDASLRRHDGVDGLRPHGAESPLPRDGRHGGRLRHDVRLRRLRLRGPTQAWDGWCILRRPLRLGSRRACGDPASRILHGGFCPPVLCPRRQQERLGARVGGRRCDRPLRVRPVRCGHVQRGAERRVQPLPFLVRIRRFVSRLGLLQLQALRTRDREVGAI